VPALPERVAVLPTLGFFTSVVDEPFRLLAHLVPVTDSTSAAARLLVVEDDPTILQLLAGALRFAGFDVATAASGSEAVEYGARTDPDLILLDVMLPDGDGFEVINRIRSAGRGVPVIFLTARTAVGDRVTGLALGGDDYVTKPFSLDEMLARIRAVLRRSRGEPDQPARLQVAGLELDTGSHEVWRDGRAISLSPNEFRLLRFLMGNAGRVVSKGEILDHVWEYDFRGESNVVESYVSYLRRKIDTSEPRLLHTVRGFGYLLRVPP
jgi:two-component system, OmpR family, response regulator